MDKATLTGAEFCKLVKSIHTGKNYIPIKIKGHGSSMSPFIKTGETLFLRPARDTEGIKIGDIVAFTDQKDTKIIIHRVIEKKNFFLKTKGDNCKNNDGWILSKKIIGIVTQKKALSGKRLTFNRWENHMIAFLSKTGILNTFLLPGGRLLKKRLQEL